MDPMEANDSLPAFCGNANFTGSTNGDEIEKEADMAEHHEKYLEDLRADACSVVTNMKIPALALQKKKRAVVSFGLHHPILSVLLLFLKITPVGVENKSSSRNCLVDLLIILFGVSSWVAVNGLWVELPVLVTTLPEAWQLASYIVITSQLANLGPLLFSAARKIWSQKVLEVPIIHSALAVAILTCALLSIFWNYTSYIFGQLHSTALLVLTFFISLVDCTSSVLFLPFIANFKEQYVISYLIGSGLSGPLPGFLAMAQGVGGYAECRNVTIIDSSNTTKYVIKPYYPPPRFSANIFFACLFGQMVISWIAFVLLNALPQAKREKVMPSLVENVLNSTTQDFSSSTENLLARPRLSRSKNCLLLFIQGFLSLIHNGVLLSIQTYSCLPYGRLAFHLTVTLSSIANPLCCVVAMFASISNVYAVGGLAVYIAGWASYILATALLSPNSPFVDMKLGGILVVLAWVMVSGTVAFTKACIANIFRKDGGQVALYRCGVVTQVGAAIGAITTFSLLQLTTLFKSYSPCS